MRCVHAAGFTRRGGAQRTEQCPERLPNRLTALRVNLLCFKLAPCDCLGWKLVAPSGFAVLELSRPAPPASTPTSVPKVPKVSRWISLPMMYTITRGPSKLVTQRRTGPTQPLENKINDFKHKQTSWSMPDLSAPKIVFNRLNGKKYHHPAPPLPADTQQEESFTATHEENVKFVHEAWQELVQQEPGPQEAQGAILYRETTPSPLMDNFVPIDLDEWWAQRFLANIDKLS